MKPVTVICICLVFLGFVLVQEAFSGHVCSACGEVIRGDYFETGGAFYHSTCFICTFCKQPIMGSFTTYRGKNYHRECFESNVALRCDVCGGIIQGKYLTDYWGDSYHTWHQGVVPVCDFCRRFIVGSFIDGMVRYPDGRDLCGRCASSAVRDRREAIALMEEVARQLLDIGISVDTRMIRLHLVGKDKLAELSPDFAGEMTGFVDYAVEKNLLGQKKSERIDVYILFGMPEVQARKAMAHELTHVWIFLKGRLKADKKLIEGSCNFSAYIVLKKTGGKNAEFLIDSMLKDDNPYYGVGFRRVKRFVERNGLKSWLSLFDNRNPSLSSSIPTE